MSQPRVPKCYPKGLIPPCWSPKPTPCPSPVSPSVTLKVSFHHAGYSSLNHQHLDWWFCWSYLCGSKWCFLVLSDRVVLSDPNPLVLSDPPTQNHTHVSPAQFHPSGIAPRLRRNPGRLQYTLTRGQRTPAGFYGSKGNRAWPAATPKTIRVIAVPASVIDVGIIFFCLIIIFWNPEFQISNQKNDFDSTCLDITCWFGRKHLDLKLNITIFCKIDCSHHHVFPIWNFIWFA